MKDGINVDYFRNDAEVEEVVRKFESGEFAPSQFKHVPHLTVSLLYLLRLPAPEALRQMRQSILSYLEQHNVDRHVYHETMTVFWMRRVGAFISQSDTARPVAQMANEMIEACGDSRLIFDYYSRQLIESEEARAKWVEPDLQPLDF